MGRTGGFRLDRPSRLAAKLATKPPEAQRTGHQFEFVGRDHEYAQAESALRQIKNGAGRIIMLSGTARIRKSRLCRRMTDQIADQDFTVHWGLCHEDVGMPPF